ncbi:MAG: sigma-54-dependent Fis family transcriptional regulator [Deltaproteobacteria bacterium CG_4_8_14_3_um_filter_51_11]|nr:sigma-54-dependent Fis family transcriptional regulator [bacterium]OIP38152.1 MAG: sigma-54-dependent Fis family transcriptional regulator [Desulfobacteraceae bacterium CG2_30_51_40]PIP48514.1 MAG: sigma-54-dependent Fis family transcriptional regulator [Deltaproteobacteria bacterium CG23_combo_of_CG06-09_8_20_14_all_51_20]PIV98968.1 MAG: sigma-54-dependent Fis family transcriptional regulator [Deltaproteobacteria bacterium CG17_big_fil_post_rev_8_21_14_2_50_51_6]PIX19370.1 MAG: sigma-54-dep
MQDKRKILIVDDEAVVRKAVERALQTRGITPRSASNGKEALGFLAGQRFDLVLLDIRMPDMDGMELLQIIKSKHPSTEVIMITGYPTIETAVDCIKLGATDYLVKPFRLSELEAALEKNARSAKALRSSPSLIERGLKLGQEDGIIIGQSRPMQKIFEKIVRVAPTDSSVLITGESGTGKELVARAIHANSARSSNVFMAVDCSALVEALMESELFGHVKGSFTGAHQTKHGLFELANTGTFFFDEIANLSLNIQAKLLRVIQERECMKVGDQKKIKLDIRIISASNKNLEESVKAGTFREDLYYRLSVVPIHIPPLRKRREDIALLSDYFIERISRKIKRPIPEISEEAMDVLRDYPWPGNVRELEHTIERVLVLEDAKIIRPGHLPASISRTHGDFQIFSEGPITLDELEKRYISFMMKRTNGKKTEAADLLGINRKTLGLKLKRYELSQKTN